MGVSIADGVRSRYWIRNRSVWQPLTRIGGEQIPVAGGAPDGCGWVVRSTGFSVIDTSATDTSATDTSATDTSATDTSATDTSATDTSATDTSATDTSATDTSATDTSATDTSTTSTDRAYSQQHRDGDRR
ncbi:uncharacterized protein Nmag_0885 [Natrialba magadii ATCC 43099]|uniref:Uncharacterized protein n=1 Tax=Natrialba magadii (strain ATCC 43099 / DSM 3394 / CCM 3739 / CIP 104546 / IAM 13178 / JCM 8861 / NBRC 102185 / NCIMB 2190 / MS3) TaxID=547559 RepID=D3T0B1_NATMM|nr:uncharacterized protein Nmag_0885 [Natrialba magadii ATCC 43099]ELY25864.1 hypothetical protein C500_16939 [Natrialba magadii ATCC 43099]